VEAFSKGMRMRLSFVRALLNNPSILFLDEPTAGLDPRNARIMKDIILGLRDNGVTVFLTTHNMTDAGELCKRIAFMVEGTLPVTDTTGNLRLKHGQKVVRVKYRADGNEAISEFGLDNLSDNRGFQEVISQHEILTIHTLEASLEEIFIKVTGQQLTTG
jgi:fluoroquinolone transport system ATP-binding protein